MPWGTGWRPLGSERCRLLYSGGLADAGGEESSGVVEGVGAGGFQEVGQGLGDGDQAVQDVEAGDQILVEDGQVADDGGPGAAALDGVALRIGILAQAEGRVVADAGQDGGGEQGQMGLGEGGQGPVLAGDLSKPEEAEGLAGGLAEGLDAPGAGYVGLSGRGRLVSLAEELQEAGVERVGRGVGGSAPG